jgi:hypothetical protein
MHLISFHFMLSRLRWDQMSLHTSPFPLPSQGCPLMCCVSTDAWFWFFHSHWQRITSACSIHLHSTLTFVYWDVVRVHYRVHIFRSILFWLLSRSRTRPHPLSFSELLYVHFNRNHATPTIISESVSTNASWKRYSGNTLYTTISLFLAWNLHLAFPIACILIHVIVYSYTYSTTIKNASMTEQGNRKVY